MIRALAWAVWIALTVFLVAWVGQAMFGVDQTDSVLPFSIDRETDIILYGLAWAGLAAFASGGGGAPRRAAARRTQLAMATVIETRSTGWTINDVPQHDVYLDVTPTDQEPFVASFRGLFPDDAISSFRPGTPVPVLFDPKRTEEVEVADLDDPGPRSALLDWRIQKGLVARELVRARLYGRPHPASVVAVRPTGARREGQVELAMTLLITPEDGTPQREADTRVFVFPEALGNLQVGSPVFAMYEPHRPEQVAVTIMREEPRS